MNGLSQWSERPDAALRGDGDDIVTEPAAVRPEPSVSGSATRDSVAAHAGVVSASGYEALRADIRRLSTMLGQTLVHHGGPELLELVEQVRRLSRSAVAGDERRRRRDHPRCSPAWTPAPRSR